MDTHVDINEQAPLLPDDAAYGGRGPHSYTAAGGNDAGDWRNPNNGSIFFDNRTFSSLEEMKGSLLETCCPGDGVLSGALSLITTAATPTMLSIPLAFVVGGWAFALSCMLFCVVVTFLSVRILTLSSISADSDDYETVAGFFLGGKGKWVVRCVLFFYNFGAAVVYLNFIKDSVTPVLVGRATFLPEWLRSDTGGSLFLICSMLAITPLTFNSRLASLRTKGFVSNLFTIFIIFAIAYRFFVPEISGVTDVKEKKALTSASAAPTEAPRAAAGAIAPFLPYMFAAPIFVFSYEVQSNVMAVIKDLHDRSGRKILVSISLALLTISSFYASLGIAGSMTFPELTEGNILARYDVRTDTLLMLCQLMCCFSAAVSYVFCIFPCRAAAFMFISDGTKTKIPKKLRAKLGVSLSAVACVLAIFLPNVAEVVSLLGALFSATLSMTFPALFAIKMRSSGTYLTGFVDGVLCYLLLFLGLGFSIMGTYMATVFSS